jgi:glutaredoxin
MNIKLYTKENCGNCTFLKSYLENLGIKFEVLDALKYISTLVSHGFSSVPVLEVNENFYTFENVTQVKDILRENGVDF